MNSVKELYDYREMIYSLVKKDLRTRYKGSVLGFLWTFINPLLQLIVYSVVFSFLMRMQMDHYSMFLFVSLLPWIFFTTSIQSGAISVVSSADLVKKIYFPRLVLPIATVTGAFINMLFSMIIMLIALFTSGVGISKHILYLPFLLILLYAFSLGLAMIFAACNVYLRDLEHILGIVTMVMFYGTPIFYPITFMPEKYVHWFYFNPMVPMVCAIQDVLYYHRTPKFTTLIGVVLYSIVFLVCGYRIFQKLQQNFVEEL